MASLQVYRVGIIQPRHNGLTCTIARRWIQHWPEPRPNMKAYMPRSEEDRRLPLLPYTPEVHPNPAALPIKHPRKDSDMRGPETVHNQLIYRQYGIIALSGGPLHGAHYDVIRDRVNKYLDFSRFFAIWRIDPPWKPLSKRSLNKRLGGGKGKVSRYETPIRAGRVIIEIAGVGHYDEVKPILTAVCNKLPLFAMPISQDIMDSLKEEKLDIDQRNYNPFNYRDLLRRNFSNSQRHISSYEQLWGGYHF